MNAILIFISLDLLSGVEQKKSSTKVKKNEKEIDTRDED